MPRPTTVLDSVRTALKSSEQLPSATSYATFELDTEGGQSNVRPPVVEITTINTVRNDDHHTDFVGYATDDSGNHIGYIYRAKFEMPIQIDVWTAEGDAYDPGEIGATIRKVLYRYDAYQAGSISDASFQNDLPDPDDPSQPLDGVKKFFVEDGEVADDLTMTPALRRWRQEAEVWFYEEINTAEEYGSENFITTVNIPSASDATVGSNVDIVFRST